MVIFLKLFRFASKLVSETLNNTISYKKKKKKKKKKPKKKKKWRLLQRSISLNVCYTWLGIPMSLNSSLYSLLHTVFLAKCSEMLKNTIFPPKFEFPAKIANIFQGPFFGPKMIGKAPCHLGSCSKLRKIVKLFKVGGGRLRSPKVGECRAKSGNVA